MPFPMVELHLSRDKRTVTTVRYGLHPKLNVSVVTGSVRLLPWDAFEVRGFGEIGSALLAYPTAYGKETCELNTFTDEQQRRFYTGKTYLLIAERSKGTWTVDKMKLVEDGTGIVSMGAAHAIEFRSSLGAREFINVVKPMF